MTSYIPRFLEAINDKKNKLAIIDERSNYNLNLIRSILHEYLVLLKSLNLLPRERVVLLGERNAESVIFFHALLLSDLIPILVDRTLNKDQVEILSGDNKKFTTDASLTNLGAIRIPAIRELLLKEQVEDFSYNKQVLDDAELFTAHTSGTTGLPKLVTYLNKNITWVIEEYKRLYNLEKNHVVLFALPFHYCFGFIACCLSPLGTGGKVVLLSEKEKDPQHIAQIIEKNKVNILVINPFFYSQLCKLDLSEYDFSCLKICDSGGEILPVEIIRKFQSQTKVLITEGYGLTETSSLTHFLTPDDEENLRLGSVGKPCPDAKCIIVDLDYKKLARGEIGELLVKGPMVIESYDDNKYNKDAFYEGWFKTGDLFYKDTDDYYYLVGRKKDAVSIPNELHAAVSHSVPALIQLPEIADLAYKFINERSLIIYVVPQSISIEKRNSSEEMILNLLPEEIKKIVQIRFVSTVPRTATGKVQKQKLKE